MTELVTQILFHTVLPHSYRKHSPIKKLIQGEINVKMEDIVEMLPRLIPCTAGLQV